MPTAVLHKAVNTPGNEFDRGLPVEVLAPHQLPYNGALLPNLVIVEIANAEKADLDYVTQPTLREITVTEIAGGGPNNQRIRCDVPTVLVNAFAEAKIELDFRDAVIELWPAAMSFVSATPSDDRNTFGFATNTAAGPWDATKLAALNDMIIDRYVFQLSARLRTLNDARIDQAITNAGRLDMQRAAYEADLAERYT